MNLFKHPARWRTLLAAILIFPGASFAGVKLASPFTSHMVLQRETKVPVWGTAASGEEVTVEFAGQKRSVKADAKIEGDSVLVSSPQIPTPAAVRYAWADNPAGCNLYNGAGLPAGPFRTDGSKP